MRGVVIQTVQVPAKGGLNLSGNRQELLKSPSVAEVLTNFEPGIKGGYQQIKGYTKVNKSNVPGTGSITGVFKYKQGLIVCRDTGIYFSIDFTTWYQVNKDENSLSLSAINSSTNVLPRNPAGSYQFNLFVFGNTEKVVMTDGVSPPCVLTITGDDPASYVVDFQEIDNASLLDPKGNEVHLNQAYYFGNTLDPHVVYHSALMNPVDMTGATAGYFAMKDRVVGVKLFNKELYVFTPTNISVVSGVDAGTPNVQPFADDVGCISKDTLQEVGGDIVFLAKDGLRSIRTAQQSDTTENASISVTINSLLTAFIKNIDQYTVTSTVIREKNQYRLFFTKIGSTNPRDHQGFIATQDPQVGWVFSTFNSFEVNNVSNVHFGDTLGDVYEMESGDSFDGTDIDSTWETPWFDLGDVGKRKALKDIELDMILSGAATVNLDVMFDYNEQDIHNPDRFEFNFDVSSSVHGSAVYGVDNYTSFVPRFPKEYLEGSGHVMKLRFSGSMSEEEWILYGFALSVTEGGNI